jgi:catechol 2,3-dioxygenase-like lactoylglutathione lyase family enzyme
MRIHHFGLEVQNIEKSISFYTEKLGFKIQTHKTATKDGIYFYVNIKLGDAELELIEIRDKNSKAKKNSSFPQLCPHIGLESFDFDQDLKLLLEKGVKIFDRRGTQRKPLL